MFNIEKGVALPPASSFNKKYPFSLMEIGDSFKTKNTKGGATYAACKKDRAITGRTYRQAKDVDGFYRVWRLS